MTICPLLPKLAATNCSNGTEMRARMLRHPVFLITIVSSNNMATEAGR